MKYQPEIIILAMEWYLRDKLNFRNRGERSGCVPSIIYKTMMYWAHKCGLQLDEHFRCHIKQTNDSWRSELLDATVNGNPVSL